MSTADLISELRDAGVRLWEEDGQVHFRAPHGIMTPLRLEALRSQKQAVIDHLRASSGAVTVVPEPAARHDPFPLTDVQGAYLLGRGTAFPYGRVACHGYGELAVPSLDPGELEAAWQTLITRHDMLRAVIDVTGSQRVLADVPPYHIRVSDLRGASPDDVAAARAATRADMDHRVYQPGEWPLFDLRLTLTRDGAFLHMSIDFLIADFVSIELLLGELGRLCHGRGAPLPPLEITFRDYLLAERKIRETERYELDRDYWLRRVDELPPAPELPTAAMAAEAAPRFRRWQTALEPAEWAGLRYRASLHGISASGAVLAAYAEVIGRWSRHKRFTLNLTLLNRLPLHPQVGSLVGDFSSVNMLAVEQDPATAFRERSRRLQAQLWQDLDHRLFSGVAVLREIARRRGADTTLMPVVFTSAIGLDRPAAGRNGNGSAAGQDTGGGIGQLVHGISQTPQVWIDCQNIERGGVLVTNWDVRDGVFPDGLIDDMFASFVGLLRRLATDDAAWDSASPVALPEDQRVQRERVNATAGPAPTAMLHEGFVTQALAAPGRTAVLSEGISLSYGDLLARCIAVGNALKEAGCRPHEVVAAAMDKGWAQVAAVLGTLAVGAAYLPVDTDQPAARRARMLQVAGARVVLTQAHLAAALEWPKGVRVIAADTLAARPGDRDLPSCGACADDLAYVIYTSGSTGTPKGVMITHRSAMNTIADINRRFGVGPGDVVLGLSGLGFDLSVYDIFGTLAAGGCLVLPDPARRADPSHWAELAIAHGVTVWNSVPALLGMLHDHLRVSPAALPSMRLALLSGDWIPVALPGQIRELIPQLRVVSLGGATEAAIWSIFHPIEEVPDEWRSIPYGKPLANQALHVLDSALRPCPVWVTGELYISGAGLALGYLGDGKLTVARFIRDPQTGTRMYRTGDLGRYLPDGSIEFLGREDSQIKIRGHRVELGEIESALHSFPAVGRAAAIATGEPRQQRHIAAFVESKRRPASSAGQAAVAELGAAASAAASEALADVDTDGYAAYTRSLDDVALIAMITALRQAGLFGGPDTTHSLDEILHAPGVAPRYRRLVRRWLGALERHGLVAREPAGAYRLCGPTDEAAVAEGWRRVAELLPAAGRESELMGYFRASTDNLAALLEGGQDPVRLLFPEGSLETSANLYEHALFNVWANRVAAAATRQIAGQHARSGPIRVLEVGGGGGGTTARVAAALPNGEVEYLFTDLSQFFLNQARERFRCYPWMTFGLLDLDRDCRPQGYAPNSFDLVVAGDVLHATRHVGHALRRIRELVAPGGWLVLLEMTRDHYQIMTSLELLVRLDETVAEFEDERRDRDQTFLTQEQWLRLLGEAGGTVQLCLPADDRPGDFIGQLGMRVFAVQFKTDQEPVDEGKLAAHLASVLPAYMLPPSVGLVDELPLSPNGKIDRKALHRLLPSQPTAKAQLSAASKEPRGELEATLAGIWAEVLNLGAVDREQNFFALGGDSLLAAQLAGRLLDEVPQAKPFFFDELLRQLLEEPTVAALAARLAGPRQEPAQPAAEEDPGGPRIAQLHGGAAQARWVIVPGPCAPVSAYRLLAAGLGDGAVLGVEDCGAPRHAGLDPTRLRELLAADYVRLLLEHCGQQPINLIGCGFGTALAAETARQLAESGASVQSLAVIASCPLPYQIEDDLLAEYLYARAGGAAPGGLGFPVEAALGRALRAVLAEHGPVVPDGSLARVGGDGELDAVAVCWQQMAGMEQHDRINALTAALPADGPWPRAAGAGQAGAMRSYQRFRYGLRIADHRQMPVYAGDMIVLRPCTETPLWPASRADTTNLWERICLGELRVADIPGDCFGWHLPANLPGATAALAALARPESGL
ncbi:MAG: amino acid adenylation domain-containing protein [Streptosporangiaceae bacterium]